ncbi:MAG: hypothetical protein JNK84_22670 [Phreatobacter sp.]|uniref:hypothetical protein n=1 Tax=Phreatobacter sp. TaxID=1966341 RepID=UPI001A5A9E5D|nr:hypothetical protein [Phreatobacter sp.]MBL8571888.1 hypothetical protein [Phreatobacter sp.]
MADNVAMNFRKKRGQPAAAEPKGEDGLSTIWLVVAAAAIGFAAYAFVSQGGIGGGLFGLLRSTQAPPAASAPPAAGPRVIAVVPGVREIEGGGVTGMSLQGTQGLSLSYVPVGPVVMRMDKSFVEVDGQRLIVPPIGQQRTGRAVLDHAMKLSNDLRGLAFTPCDRSLRYLAAANINLFVASFMPLRAPIDSRAAANTSFWSRTEASTVRRTVHELAEKGALAPFDFGIDTSPEVKGLFEGVRLGQPACG